jgi:hypothetical protein
MLNLKVAIRLKRGGRPGKVLISEFSLDQQVPQINAGMIKAIVRAHKWDQQIRAGASITAIAKKESVHRTYVGQILPLANLAPDITEAILDGRQPEDLKVEHLLTALPNNWANQRKQLGFAA